MRNALLTAHDGVVVATDEEQRDAVLVDPLTGETSPAPIAPRFDRRIVGDLLVHLGPDGAVIADDVDSGERLWTTPLTTHVGAPAIDGGLLVFPTPVGAIALDAGDGSLRWSWADETLEGRRR